MICGYRKTRGRTKAESSNLLEGRHGHRASHGFTSAAGVVAFGSWPDAVTLATPARHRRCGRPWVPKKKWSILTNLGWSWSFMKILVDFPDLWRIQKHTEADWMTGATDSPWVGRNLQTKKAEAPRQDRFHRPKGQGHPENGSRAWHPLGNLHHESQWIFGCCKTESVNVMFAFGCKVFLLVIGVYWCLAHQTKWPGIQRLGTKYLLSTPWFGISNKATESLKRRFGHLQSPDLTDFHIFEVKFRPMLETRSMYVM